MLLELNWVIRWGLVVLISVMTIRCSVRGLQNGLLLFLIASLLPIQHGMLIYGGGLPHLTVDRIVWPLVLLVFVVQWRRGEIKSRSTDLVEQSMFILLLVILLNMYFHGKYISHQNPLYRDKLQLAPLLSGFILPYMSYFIMRRAVLSETQVKSFLTGVGLITIYLGITGIGEASNQGWLVFPKYILEHEGIHIGKVRGPFLQASWNGLALAMGLTTFLWLIFWLRDRARWLWLLGIASVAISLPYVLQRAAWLSAAAVFAAALMTWPPPRYAFKLHCALISIVLLAIPVSGLVLSQALDPAIISRVTEPDNIEFRYELAEATTNMIGDNVLFGVGFTRFEEELPTYGLYDGFSSHNSLLTLFAELGLLGLLPYLFIFARLLFESVNAYRFLPQSRPIVAGLWGMTGAYIIMAMSVEVRGVLYANLLLFASWGMLLEMIRGKYYMLRIPLRHRSDAVKRPAQGLVQLT
jgi:O-antigen ligase